MSTKTSIRRKRDEAAGKVRAMQVDRKGVPTGPDTPPVTRYPRDSIAGIVRQNRIELNQPQGGVLLFGVVR